MLLSRAENNPENKDMYLSLTAHKQTGVGAYVIASAYYLSQGNGYEVKSFIMFKDFNKRIDASIVRAGRVTDKVMQQSLDLAKNELPNILAQVKQHYPNVTQWEV